MVEYLDPGPWPGFIGDRREKFVRITLGPGEEIEHSDVFFFISAGEFVISSDESHTDTIHYDITEVSRVEVIQHHTACFITTAVAGNDEVLNSLRSFRDNSMEQTAFGTTLLQVYDTVSPPISRTLAAHPDSKLTHIVRGLVHRCASIADTRRQRDSSLERRLLSISLGLLYITGLLLGLCVHLLLTAFTRLES